MNRKAVSEVATKKEARLEKCTNASPSAGVKNHRYPTGSVKSNHPVLTIKAAREARYSGSGTLVDGAGEPANGITTEFNINKQANSRLSTDTVSANDIMGDGTASADGTGHGDDDEEEEGFAGEEPNPPAIPDPPKVARTVCGRVERSKRTLSLAVTVALLMYDFSSDIALLWVTETKECVSQTKYDCSDNATDYTNMWKPPPTEIIACHCDHGEVLTLYELGWQEEAPLRYSGGCFWNADTGREERANLTVAEFVENEYCGCQRIPDDVWQSGEEGRVFDGAADVGEVVVTLPSGETITVHPDDATTISGASYTDPWICRGDSEVLYICIIVFVSITIVREFVKMVLILLNICQQRERDNIRWPLVICESPFLVLFLFFRPTLWTEMARLCASGELNWPPVMLFNLLTEDLPSIIVSVAILSDPFHSDSMATGKAPTTVAYAAIFGSVLVLCHDLWRVRQKCRRDRTSSSRVLQIEALASV